MERTPSGTLKYTVIYVHEKKKAPGYRESIPKILNAGRINMKNET